jgi:hypothetical protein
MAPMEEAILHALDGRELFMYELVGEIRGKSQASATSVKAAVLPLILRDCIELTPGLKLRLQSKPSETK